MMIIGIDHGNAQIKTAHVCFPAGIEEYSVKPPMATDLIEQEGRFWTLIGKRVPFMRNKTQDDRYFLLTLFAICKELEARREFSRTVTVALGVGLPPEHYGALRDTFAAYFKRPEPISFTYNEEQYRLRISHVFVYPQAYAAVATRSTEMLRTSRTFVIDIGGYTTDILLLRNGRPDLEFCRSLNMGAIQMSNHIAGKVNALHDLTIDEQHVAEVLGEGNDVLPQNVQSTIRREVEQYAANLLNKLRELEVDLRSNAVVFIGGGAILLRPYLEQSSLVGKHEFILDTKANAAGYELLTTAQLRRLARNGGVMIENG